MIAKILKKSCFCFFFSLVLSLPLLSSAQNQTSKNPKELLQLQQDFINLGFGMFIHFNIPTFMYQDWADPSVNLKIPLLSLRLEFIMKENNFNKYCSS